MGPALAAMGEARPNLRLVPADLSNEAFPWLSVRTIDIGYTRAIALRVNYVGELGWELDRKSVV